MRFNIQTERENDGRWIAEIADIPGVLAYGRTENQAKANAFALALRVIADRAEKSRTVPDRLLLWSRVKRLRGRIVWRTTLNLPPNAGRNAKAPLAALKEVCRAACK